MAKRAVKVTATTVTAECPCGGSVIDTRNGSYQLDSDSRSLACDSCEEEVIIMAKTAHLFA